MRSVIVAGLLAITTCASSANTSEIPHPPFTAERFDRFYDEAIYNCLHQEVYKAKYKGERTNVWRGS
jgi:hypothetical protein